MKHGIPHSCGDSKESNPNPGQQVLHESRNTRHESRLFFETRPFCRVGRPLMREGGRPAGFKGGCTKRGKTNGKEFFLNPETGITTYTESGFGSRFGIPHYSLVFVGKIRISPCRQSSASAHCGNRDIGFMDVSSPRLTFPGPQVSPSGEAKGERATNRETRPFTKCAAQAGASSEVFTKHETRDTKHGFYAFLSSVPFFLTANCCAQVQIGGTGMCTGQRPSGVSGGRHCERRSLEIPEKCTKSRLQWTERQVRSPGSRRTPGCFRRGERRRNPCRGSRRCILHRQGMFSISSAFRVGQAGWIG